MKKLVILIFALLLGFAASAQDRTVTKYMGINDTYYKYDGTTSDYLVAAGQDTIDFILYYRAHWYVEKISVKIKWDLRTAADTTVTTSLFGAEFGDHTSYTQIIAAAAGNDINADNTIDVLTSDPYTGIAQVVATSDTAGNGTIKTLTYAAHNATPFDKSYRKYRLRMIITDASGLGTGVKIDDIEFKFYVD